MKRTLAKYLQEIAETSGDIAKTAEKFLHENFLPLVLSGDHSIAAAVPFFRSRSPNNPPISELKSEPVILSRP